MTPSRLVFSGLLRLMLPSAPPIGIRTVVAPRTRTYYIAADEVTWDYVPGGRDEIAGRPYTDSAFFASARPRPVEHGLQEGALPRIHRQHVPHPQAARRPSGSISAFSAR